MEAERRVAHGGAKARERRAANATGHRDGSGGGGSG
eukprot:CAMPEP_0198701274 /NCGR_PEP_ID=MMETSP1468-20131203/382663_1 /TAXON_ID=1461545 /ORGANISM="Mantoniella sp, Strain CCMP1436" /LENGTH=35 /DNA_ID= /DNA_START= /DNA_END= /DNA_ORIENTATION=